MTNLRERKLIIRHANGSLNLIAGDITKGLGERFEREDVYASCFTCLNMQDQSGQHSRDGKQEQSFYCKRWNAYPPLKVLVNSCGTEGYEDNDDIPF